MDITKTCEQCGKTFTRNLSPSEYDAGRGRFCSHSCSANARWSGLERKGRQYDTMPTHPLASKSGKIPHARRVMYDQIGPRSHPCHWCHTTLKWRVNRKGGSTYGQDLLVDHLDGNVLNDELTNLVPSCGSCNTVRSLARGWEERTNQSITDLLSRQPS